MHPPTPLAVPHASRPGAWLVRYGGLAAVATVLLTLSPRWLARPLLRRDTPGRADAIVVLGGAVGPRCEPEAASLALAARAARLYREGRAGRVLFVGGRSRDESCAVAPLMADLARRAGVPEENIRVETTPTTTREAAIRSDADLMTLGASHVLLVTPELQMRRAEAGFERLGYAVERSSVPEDDLQVPPWGLLRSTVGGYLAWAVDSVRAAGAERIDHAHVSVPASFVQAAAPRPVRRAAAANGPIVLFGTSYAASWPLDQIDGVPIVNRGHGGDTTAQLLGRFDKDVVALAPRAVVIWGFDNDLFDARGGNLERAMQDVEHNTVCMIDMAQARGIRPILATEVTMRRPVGVRESIQWTLWSVFGRATYQDRINKQVLDGNVWLRELARRRQLPLLDVQPLVSDRLQHRYEAFAKPDGAHITPAGYAVITDYARRVLNPYFAAQSAPEGACRPSSSLPCPRDGVLRADGRAHRSHAAPKVHAALDGERRTAWERG
jgi:uncharacterized SAM-binding protein YcdF (DUF218 family)/lysophospholipase L1-like esterase